MFKLFDENEIRTWLLESGVDNGLGHYENGKLQTAITSYEELVKLIEIAYTKGFDDAYC